MNCDTVVLSQALGTRVLIRAFCQYHWIAQLAPPNIRTFMSYIMGMNNSKGWDLELWTDDHSLDRDMRLDGSPGRRRIPLWNSDRSRDSAEQPRLRTATVARNPSFLGDGRVCRTDQYRVWETVTSNRSLDVGHPRTWIFCSACPSGLRTFSPLYSHNFTRWRRIRPGISPFPGHDLETGELSLHRWPPRKPQVMTSLRFSRMEEPGRHKDYPSLLVLSEVYLPCLVSHLGGYLTRINELIASQVAIVLST